MPLTNAKNKKYFGHSTTRHRRKCYYTNKGEQCLSAHTKGEITRFNVIKQTDEYADRIGFNTGGKKIYMDGIETRKRLRIEKALVEIREEMRKLSLKDDVSIREPNYVDDPMQLD